MVTSQLQQATGRERMAKLLRFHQGANLQYKLQKEIKKTTLLEATLTLLMMASIMLKSEEEKSSKLQQVRMVKFQALP